MKGHYERSFYDYYLHGHQVPNDQEMDNYLEGCMEWGGGGVYSGGSDLPLP